MEPYIIGVLGFVILFILLAIGMPIGFALSLVALGGTAVVSNNFTAAIGMIGYAPFSIVLSHTWAVIPLFVLMGFFAFNSGMTQNAYRTAFTLLGRLPGGLAISTIFACTFFAACTGSSNSSVSLFASTALPEMERFKYDPRLASGCIASGCTLGILIPPSVPMITYGLFSDTSIGALFMAGVFPGIILSSLFVIAIIIWATINPRVGPKGPSTTWREKLISLRNLWPVILLMGILFFGLWGGVFTAVEAGGVGAIAALLIGIKHITKSKFIESVRETARIAGMLFVIMIGAIMFNYFVAQSGLSTILANAISSSHLSPLVVVIFIMIFYLIGGCLMDSLGLMLLTLPIFIPIVQSIGYNLIVFGIITTIQVEMAAITPPIGINVFVLSGMAKHIPMQTIFRGIWPFLICMIICLALVLAFPSITLFLPSTMR